MIVTITQHPRYPYLRDVVFPYDREAQQYIRSIPGNERSARPDAWDGGRKCWVVGYDQVPALTQYFNERGIAVEDESKSYVLPTVHEQLHPFQVQAAAKCVQYKRFILAFATGLGKSAAVLWALHTLRPARTLIVCPASVRLSWIEQLKRWWPDHPHTEVIEYGRDRKLSKKKAAERDWAYQAPVQIVSYSLLEEVNKGWDAIVFDEAHLLQHPTSKQYRAAAVLTEANPNAGIFGLSATIAPNQPSDVYGPLSVIMPSLWGKLQQNRKRSFVFSQRYCDGELGEYGWTFSGITPDDTNAQELSSRLKECSLRITRAEVAHLLPPYTMDIHRIDGEKLEAVAEHVASGGSHQTVFVYHHEMADAVAERLRKDKREVYVITGEMPPGARDAALATARQADSAILVCTMKAMGIGIDLGFAPEVIFAELYTRAEVMTQALGRVGGFRTKNGAYVTILVDRTSQEETKQAYTLRHRVNALMQLQEGEQTEEALTQLCPSDEEIQAEIAELFIEEADEFGLRGGLE